jgi:hypothetical protein
MTTRKIIISVATVLFLALFTVCGPWLINLVPSLPNCIHIVPERCDWGNKDSLIWVVEGDQVQVHSVIYNRIQRNIDNLLIHFYDAQMIENYCWEEDWSYWEAERHGEAKELIGTQTLSLKDTVDQGVFVPWSVPIHCKQEKRKGYAHHRNYKRHLLYTLIDPYDHIEEITDTNNVARTPSRWKAPSSPSFSSIR